MLNKFFGRFSEDIGIDLGTANTLVFVKEKGIIMNEPSIVAVNTRTNQIVAVGHTAKDMLGKTPPHIITTRPLFKGVISDFEITEKMLRYFIDKIHENSFTIVPRPRVVIGVPLDVTEVERKAVEDAVVSAGAREVFLVEEPMAAAIGARLPITESVGSMIVDIGGGTTEIAVISLGGVVTWKSLTIAGEEMTKNIIQYTRDVFNLLVGEKIAENVKCTIGSAIDLEEPETMEMRGRDLITGLPRQILINDGQVREALHKSIKAIVDNIKATLEVTPPELVADIYERGIVICGGGALLKGMDKMITKETDVPVRIATDPLTTVVRGTGALLDDQKLLDEVTLPSTGDEIT
ncbi:rod shape-determining protein [Candidatus Uhrbacteria bacterium CG_4_9_14_0_2_um_filter_41_50]|uniref:Cell shape-determining protein MreB n=1 Tax=Candidatus Uhrbacteria bacterium CG_4_9_14_0_2_um_filter_41_50 TaxID=1975031 RepID=A0A2M8EP21_9BACT|nr:MAG: rod shape-determining protein [Candidatus Uhrbacteria bacterium CG_4_10_14_3_um_filter_41_21]PIZ54388.1 MAG: rod shape-determining protein [Candidatus Uhrbacteria bacterium CG_4_10_14_0_2_um_filter_41_21]PJB84986.1 MAG: rod shape-determining protein [Candidatus Uhrbacteria bacterium CG_4_9_14_0_8_um_filter_41_16]PJC24493.1 MAG: rod shape-determining protein [Candidatus Uhrbacteria bacterium CG_4_9_14_0_2_um_filter_41_50]PJE74719.1 MAG: rod shape-determining protein [Candidatus Uhrbacter